MQDYKLKGHFIQKIASYHVIMLFLDQIFASFAQFSSALFTYIAEDLQSVFFSIYLFKDRT